MNQAAKEKKYLDTVFNYYRYFCGLNPVNPLNFDFAFNWFLSGIPLDIIWHSMRKIAGKYKDRITSLYWFSWEIKRNYSVYLMLKVGEHLPGDEICVDQRNVDQRDSIEKYIAELSDSDKTKFEDRLLEKFKDDQELNINTKIFLRTLSPHLQDEKNERRYRLNYLFLRLNKQGAATWQM